jgi:hypothetical protein
MDRIAVGHTVVTLGLSVVVGDSSRFRVGAGLRVVVGVVVVAFCACGTSFYGHGIVIVGIVIVASSARSTSFRTVTLRRGGSWIIVDVVVRVVIAFASWRFSRC